MRYVVEGLKFLTNFTNFKVEVYVEGGVGLAILRREEQEIDQLILVLSPNQV